jgi:hypothetical protein
MGILDDIKRPINVITLVLAVVGVGLSIYFYYKSQQQTILAYSISDLLVFDRENAASISVLDKNQTPISENVYASTILLWNKGDVDLDPPRIRTPINVQMIGSGRILEAAIIEQTDPDISGLAIEISDQASKQVSVKWAHLDPGQAVRFRVLYAGVDASRLELKGNVLGIKEFTKIAFTKPDTGWLLVARWAGVITPFIFLVIVLLPPRRRIDYIMATIVVVGATVNIVIFINDTYQVAPL